MRTLDRLVSTFVVLDVASIDTDQIIPARFLTSTKRVGFGSKLFHDWRFRPDGTPVASFPLNSPSATSAQILVAGHNFGCGSSREHAPWALAEFGFRAVISTGIADIFRNNALKIGLLPVVVDHDHYAKIVGHPNARLVVDLLAQRVGLEGDEERPFEIDPFARRCILSGHDALDVLLAFAGTPPEKWAARSVGGDDERSQ